MARTVGIGIQNFEKIITNNFFYVDKTSFIKEWWESGDSVTLITRPRRFGKTLNLNMLNYFFSVEHAGRSDLFEHLSIWKEEKYRKIQGTYPVINLTFADIKSRNYDSIKKEIYLLLVNLYEQNRFILDGGSFTEVEKELYNAVNMEMDEVIAAKAIQRMCNYMYRYYGKKVIVLLDEYDTPMQESYVNGFWEEMVAFIRSMFNSTFKTNEYLESGIMTGITRVSKESVFSDLNNLKVVTTTSNEYATSFGFTEEEVFAALEECGYADMKENVKAWYDGFIFGKYTDIYNPWSVLHFLDTGKLGTHWANTSSNGLVSKLIREGNRDIKTTFECLLRGGTIRSSIDEQIVYNQLSQNPNAIWSLLLASGYLKVLHVDFAQEEWQVLEYELTLTNREVRLMFTSMVNNWFAEAGSCYNDFIKSMLNGDLEAMNEYMNELAMETFSYFDAGSKNMRTACEKFYHGFVIGLLVELRDRYTITSNRESGLGRYDVMLEPKHAQDDAFVLEFKVFNAKREKTLEDTVASALTQIEEKQYAAGLMTKGIPEDKIHKYGFAFEGKTVLIG